MLFVSMVHVPDETAQQASAVTTKVLTSAKKTARIIAAWVVG